MSFLPSWMNSLLEHSWSPSPLTSLAVVCHFSSQHQNIFLKWLHLVMIPPVQREMPGSPHPHPYILVIARLFNMFTFWYLWKSFLLPLSLLDLQADEFGHVFNSGTHFSGDLEFKEQHPFYLHSLRAAEDRYQTEGLLMNHSPSDKACAKNEMQPMNEQGVGVCM